MPHCTYCGEHTDNPCLGPRDTKECPNYSATPTRPDDELHASEREDAD